MKKLSYLIVLALILGLVLTGCSLLSNVGQVPSSQQSGVSYLTKSGSLPNLVALWRFDEGSFVTTVADSVSGNTGDVVGATTGVPGKFGNALSFDGNNDYVKVVNPTNLDVTDYTFELWINANSFTNVTYPTLLNRRVQSASLGYYWIWIKGNKIVLTYTNGLTTKSTSWLTDFFPGEWYHIALTKIGSSFTMYQNGSSLGTKNLFYVDTAGGDLFIGTYQDQVGNKPFDGIIDEVRIWDGALTPSQIAQSYEALHVDDDWVQWPGAYYTITEALAVAGDGDTIIVHEGTYDGFKVSNKTDLTISGTGNPVVSGSTVVVGTDTALIGVEDSENITIGGLTVDATGIVATPFAAILYTESTGTIEDNTIQNIGDLGQGAGAIRVNGGDSIAILDNTIDEFNKSGIMVGDVLSVQIEGNIISTTNYNLAPNGIQVGYVMDNTATTGTVNNNQVSGCQWNGYNSLASYETSGNWTGSGILVIAPYSTLEISGNEVQSCDVGLDIEAGTGTLITNNEVHHNSYGFVLWNANPVINCNNIYDNGLAGVHRTSDGDLGGLLVATYNWWGHATGPDGLGDKVSGNVNYSNWAYIPDFCGCEAKTIGYWKNHPEWVEGIIDVLDEELEVGGELVAYTLAELIFDKPNSKTYQMLAAQLLAAKLNVAQLRQFNPAYNFGCLDINAGDPPLDRIVAADDLLTGKLSVDVYVKLDKDDKDKVNEVKYVLDEFNNNNLECGPLNCPCACD